MGIPVISQIIPKNNQNFGIADVNDLIGGYMQMADTIAMNAIPASKIKTGMLCYCITGDSSGNHLFQYIGGWDVYSSTSNNASVVQQVALLTDLNSPKYESIGAIVFVQETSDLRWYNGTNWETFQRIYIQNTPPDDTGGIWIDTSETDYASDANAAMKDLIAAVSTLTQYVGYMLWGFQSEMDFGDATNNAHTDFSTFDKIEPSYGDSVANLTQTAVTDIANGIVAQEPSLITPNCRHLLIKRGTYKQIVANEANFLSPEFLWGTDTCLLYVWFNGKLYTIGSSSTGGNTDNTVDGILTSTINNATKITGIEMVDIDNTSNTYLMEVKDGKFVLHDYRLDTNSLSGNAQTLATSPYYTPQFFPISNSGNTSSPLIYINMMYCGADSDSTSYNPCNYNFIELANLTSTDLNLKGLYLHYTEMSSGEWISLPLIGIIPAGNTFLIRGSQCSVTQANTTVINVSTYDMLWTKSATYNSTVLEVTGTNAHSVWGNDGMLKMANNCSIYLSGEPSTNYYKTNVLTTTAPWSTNGVLQYFVDLVGIGSYNSTSMPSTGTAIASDTSNMLLMRYYCMDNVSQAVKSWNSNSNSTDWTYINLSNINPALDVSNYRPRSSSEGKNIFFDKHLLTEGAPNIVTCGFGYNAHTTRCFTWVSVGYYDEYLQVTTVSGDYSNPTQIESFYSGDGRSTINNRGNAIYNRIRWITTDGMSVTTHKVIADFTQPTAGTTQKYYYRVGRPGYWSTERSFTMRNRSDVITNGFNFCQVTDQQGFKGEEYETWKLSANFIVNDKINHGYDFVINTGDIAQNGNRINEWLDYFNGGNNMFQDTEQMFVIGNNDLCKVDPSVLIDGSDTSKVNSYYINYFFTYEYPYTIPYATNGKYVDSVYSFIYGNTYFLAMNSEITTTTSQTIFGDANIGDTYKLINTWCTNDLTNIDSNITHKIAYCHDAPITLVGANLMYSFVNADLSVNTSVKRGGSHLNTVGNYWFAPFLESNGFKVCIAGHKHTYLTTRLVKENPSATMQPYVYDANYIPAEGSTAATYPSWYTALPSINKKCVTLTNDATQAYVRYIVCQATGYKVVSNTDLPGMNIPWVLDDYPDTEVYNSTTRTATTTVNAAQKFSHYIIYNVGTGTETVTPGITTTSRARIYAIPYKIVLTATPTSAWTYKYNTPITLSQLEHVGGNGSTNPNNDIIIEL